MPQGRKSQKRLPNVIGNAVHVMRSTIDEIGDNVPPSESEGKDPAAVALGRKGGKARANGMSAKRRKEIAQMAAAMRWKKDS